MRHHVARSALVVTLAATTLAAPVSAAIAAHAPSPRIIAHFELAAGQTPENLVLEPGGAAIVSFANANQVARVTPSGTVRVLAQLPHTGGCSGFFPGPATLGLARTHDGSIYVLECSGTTTNGVWRIRPGQAPVQIATLPPNAVPNGMGRDEHTGNLYIADSVLGVVWRVSTHGGTPIAWAADPALQPTSFAGANGLVVHHGAVYVGNIDKGLVVRIPIRGNGTPGPVKTVATGLEGIDDFSVVGPDDTIVAAMVMNSQVVEVKPGRRPQVLLTATDGLSNPTSVRPRGDLMYVTNAAYFAGSDPNLQAFRRTNRRLPHHTLHTAHPPTTTPTSTQRSTRTPSPSPQRTSALACPLRRPMPTDRLATKPGVSWWAGARYPDHQVLPGASRSAGRASSPSVVESDPVVSLSSPM